MVTASGLPENQMRSNRGEQGVGIALSPRAVSAWEEGGKILHDDFGGRMIAIRLVVNDAKKRSVGLFLVSARILYSITYIILGVSVCSCWQC